MPSRRIPLAALQSRRHNECLNPLPPAKMTDPRFHDDPTRNRYQLMVGDEEVGYIEYDPVGETSILIKHTEVMPGHEGQGLGSQLVRSALDHIRAQGKSVIPICPYALNYVRRHPEYRELVREDMRRTL